MSSNSNESAPEFAHIDRAQWQAAAEGVLKGRSIDTLVTTTLDGLAIQPLYASEPVVAASEFPGAGSMVRGDRPAGNPDGFWDVRALVWARDPAEANRLALIELENGANSLHIRLAPEQRLGAEIVSATPVADLGGGVVLAGVDDLDRLLEGVLLDSIEVRFEAGLAAAKVAEWFVQLVDRRGIDRAAVSGCLGLDPLGNAALSGRLDPDAFSFLGGDGAFAALPGCASLAVDGALHADMGASDAVELAAVLATTAEYLRALEGAGVSIPAAFDQLSVTVGLTADQFVTIAKVRAARRVLAALAEVLGVTGVSTPIHGRMTSSIVARHDPWVNMLRGTAASLAGAVGGCRSIVTLPYDLRVLAATEFGLRVARNTQLLLQDESHLGAMIDPAGGSDHVETLTEELAAAAWLIFREIEANGGFTAEVTSGRWAERVGEVRARHDRRVATRRDPLTGVSEFPLLAQPELEGQRPSEVVASDATTQPPHTGAEPLGYYFEAHTWEALRDRSDAALAATGSRPSVTLLGLGPLREYTARLTWTQNVFEAGGIAPELVEWDPGASTPVECGRLVCLVGSDDTYAAGVADAVAAATAAGAKSIWMAGRPGEFAKDGVSGFVHAGLDFVSVLDDALTAALGGAADSSTTQG